MCPHPISLRMPHSSHTRTLVQRAVLEPKSHVASVCLTPLNCPSLSPGGLDTQEPPHHCGDSARFRQHAFRASASRASGLRDCVLECCEQRRQKGLARQGPHWRRAWDTCSGLSPCPHPSIHPGRAPITQAVPPSSVTGQEENRESPGSLDTCCPWPQDTDGEQGPCRLLHTHHAPSTFWVALLILHKQPQGGFLSVLGCLEPLFTSGAAHVPGIRMCHCCTPCG